MCHYITVILAGTINLEEINRIAQSHSILLCSATNRFVSHYMKSDEIYLLDTYGHCACGTSLCQYDHESERINAERLRLERGKAKRRKSGWSQTKINRWEEQQTRNIERYHGKLSEAKPGLDCQEWADFGNKLFKHTCISRFGMILHYYSESITSENAAHNRVVFPQKKLTPETLFRMKEETINIFIRN